MDWDIEILDLEVHPLTWWVDQFASGSFKCKETRELLSSAVTSGWLGCLRSALALAVPTSGRSGAYEARVDTRARKNRHADGNELHKIDTPVCKLKFSRQI